MKKSITVSLLAALLLASSGCAATENNPIPTKPEKEESPSENKLAASSVGKVKSVVGNEITISLMASDFVLSEEMKNALGLIELSEEERKELESGGQVLLEDGGVIGGTIIGGSGSQENEQPDAGEAIVVPEQNEHDEEAAQKEYAALQEEARLKKEAAFNKMEFLGETKDLIIKAGTPILNEVTGEMAYLEDIRKGSILSIDLDEKGNVVRVVIKY